MVIEDNDEVQVKLLQERIVIEMKVNKERYSGFVGEGWEKMIEGYILREWDQDIVDIVPLVISDILKRGPMIINANSDYKIREVWIINEKMGETIMILRKSDHYWRVKIERKDRERRNEKYRRATMVLPYVGSEVSKEMRRVCERARVKCNIIFKRDKVYNCMKSQTVRGKDDMGDEKGVIHQLRCKICNMCYIGKMKRELKIRFKEHMRMGKDEKNTTEVGRHSVKVHGKIEKEMWYVRILGRAKIL